MSDAGAGSKNETREAVTAARAVAAAVGAGQHQLDFEKLRLATQVARSEADAMVAQLAAERELREGLRDFLRNLAGSGLDQGAADRRLRWLGLLDDVERSSSMAAASRLARAAEVASLLLRGEGVPPPRAPPHWRAPIPFTRRRKK